VDEPGPIQGGNAQWWSTHSFAGYQVARPIRSWCPGRADDDVAQACPGGELYPLGFTLAREFRTLCGPNGLAFTDPQGSFLYQ